MSHCFQFCSEENNRKSERQLFTNKAHRKDVSHANDYERKTNQEMDDMMSRAFKLLTFRERQEQQDALHGVDGQITEDEPLLNHALQALDNQLKNIKSGSVYEQAEKIDPLHVSSRAFRLMFLRGNRYDAKAAADQMLRFFKMKQQIFGTEKLIKNITIEDLDEDDRACLRSGCMQATCKDTSNRPIFFQAPSLVPTPSTHRNIRSLLRVRFFITMKLLKSEETQRRGAIGVTYLVGEYQDRMNGEGYLESYALSMALPLYMAAFHGCTDDWAQAALSNLVLRIMPAKEIARFRLHFGTHLECQYKLASYGIPSSLLPLIPETNIIDLAPQLQWYHRCLTDDGSDGLVTKTSPMGSVTEPSSNDVLLAGSKRLESAGNERVRDLIKKFVEEYKSGSNKKKRCIVDRIMDDIHGTGGRFLQQEKGSSVWTEVSGSKVRLKMTQRFRNYIRREAPGSQQARRSIPIPLPNDVIFGRAQNSEGNALLNHLIKDRSEEYEAMNHGKKVIVLDAIMESIKGGGGRFLERAPDSEGYRELSADSVRDRIATYLRNHRRSLKNENIQCKER